LSFRPLKAENTQITETIFDLIFIPESLVSAIVRSKLSLNFVMADTNAVKGSKQEVDFQPVQHAEEQFRLAENENRAVVESKILVLLLLLGAGATLGVATFVTTTVAEDSEFRTQVCTAKIVLSEFSLLFSMN
jgi:hypothetical protein